MSATIQTPVRSPLRKSRRRDTFAPLIDLTADHSILTPNPSRQNIRNQERCLLDMTPGRRTSNIFNSKCNLDFESNDENASSIVSLNANKVTKINWQAKPMVQPESSSNELESYKNRLYKAEKLIEYLEVEYNTLKSRNKQVQKELQTKQQLIDQLRLNFDNVGTDDCIRLFKLLEALKSGNKSDIDLYCRPIAAEYQNQNLKNAAANPLILAVQCADLETVKYVLEKNFDINSIDLDGLTPLHHAARLDRFDFVEFLLKQPHVDEIACDNVGRKPYQLARNTELQKFMKQHLKYRQAAIMQEFHTLLKQRKIDALDSLMDDRFAHAVIDVNQPFANSNLFPLQEFVKAKDVAIIQWLLRNGADSFRRNKSGKNAVEMCKDDQIRQILKESQNSAIINNIDSPKKPVKITGYLKKWTNYKSGYKMRWVVLDDGIMSYFKSSEDAATACRGSISLKYAKIRYDTSAKNGFEVFSGGNTKYIFKASHPIEAQRWVWAISTSIQQMKDASRSKITESVHSGTSSNYGDTASFYNVVSDKKNVSSFSLLSNDHSADNTDDDSICVGESNREEQHLDNLYFSANTLNLQLQVTNQLALGIVDELKANNIDKVAEIAQSLQLSLSSMQNAYQEIVRVAKDREVKWQKSLDHESELRRLWEDTIQKLSIEQEAMIHALEKSELERKKTKKFLKSFQEKVSVPNPPIVEDFSNDQGKDEKFILHPELLAHLQEISTSEVGSDSDDEFFDAVATGDLKLNVSDLSISAQNVENDDRVKEKEKEISISFKGYPKKIRETLDTVDDRPKLSLWSILKSMIGKDMTKMTLPVTFNEPTSLLYRAAEDMEYVNLLNIASTLDESTKRLIYVAAFAASEYSSTTLRIAKPFNPILGETFEYCRPDMKYRFLIEQVSHHPPIGAAYSESPYWEYWGESSVKSKFYGKSFDINPLGTWYLKLKYHNGEELYTWKKVTTSVVGIITGSPVVDNYGLMEIQNHTNGEKCVLNFKPRGWRAHSAYEVKGEVKKSDGSTVYTLAGHWNSKIYARGLEDRDEAFLIWQANERPPAPFNLTKFVISLNYLPKELIPWLPPTDSRFRPDQRAMEEGRYDDAAKEKERLEEAQRLRKRQREQKHIQYKPKWFVEDKHPITQELYWKYLGHYWEIRDKAGTSKLNGDKNSYWEGLLLMKLNLKKLDNSMIVVDAEGSMTIEEIKNDLRKSQNIGDEMNVQLVYGGRMLDDTKTCDFYKLHEMNGKFIVLLLNKKPVSVPKPAEVPQPSTQSTVQPSVLPSSSVQEPNSNDSVGESKNEGSSSLVLGPEREARIAEMESMGFQREEILKCLKLAYYNPERAVEYLLNGIPENLQQAGSENTATSESRVDQERETSSRLDPSLSNNLTPQSLAGLLANANRHMQTGGLGGPEMSEAANAALSGMSENELKQSLGQLLQLVQDRPAEVLQLLQTLGINSTEASSIMEGLQQLGTLGSTSETPQMPELTEEERETVNKLQKLLGCSIELCIEAYIVCNKNESDAINYILNLSD